MSFPKKTTSVLVVAILLFVAVNTQAVGQKPQNVVVSKIQELEFSGSQNSVGIVSPSKVARVGAAVDGRVAEFLRP